MTLFKVCANGQLDIPLSASSDALRKTPENSLKVFMCFSLIFAFQMFVKFRHLYWSY